MQTDAPNCECNPAKPSVLKISASAANPNRPFWCCELGKAEYGGCGFFNWQDQPLRGAKRARPSTNSGPGGFKSPASAPFKAPAAADPHLKLAQQAVADNLEIRTILDNHERLLLAIHAAVVNPAQ